ncbi:hypothetical protein GCM10025857_28710 [Alicyclobacillus contaminans]|uniref:DUF4825 domain-containing protein n=1 Tax=Alicyclobacillus contaminans TaxID=392016 RepID=UPI0003F800A4|nr:DUF4825 domain-containing protein [Alicyclobacillus contaminans]GMA51514.1 hypothetical protein GCM10025857_28710 [Alicyclobacillus contaminans]
MKMRNLVIILLLAIGVFAFVIVEFSVKPIIRARQQAYLAAQENPLTHDVQGVLQYRNAYMGNASNDAHLNANLPLGRFIQTYELHPNQLELVIHYRRPDLSMTSSFFKAALLYDATANFALIGNLQAITFDFPAQAFHATRDAVQRWYGLNPSTLASGSTWKTQVQRRLGDEAYVNAAFAGVFGTRTS